MKVKKPVYNAKELNSNIAYGVTSVNNINQDELNSIQWLCEKSMNDDILITELKEQLETTEQLRQEALKEGLKVVERDSSKIEELQKQLEEKKKEIDEFKRIGEKGHLNDLLEDKRKENRILIKASEQLLQRLENQPAEIIEKIRKSFESKMKNSLWQEEYPVGKVCNMINDVLDETLKEYEEKE